LDKTMRAIRWPLTWSVAGLFLLSPLLASALDAPPLRVSYPAAESTRDARQAYPKAVLAMALAHAGRPYILHASTVPANQRRVARLLAAGDDIDVMWTVATDARERELRRIPYAIDRGMIGWRVLLVRRSEAHRFDNVRDLKSLGALQGAQGHDWPDLPILRGAGLHVLATPSYDSLFAMLSRGRVDYVPRSVLEVGDELAHRPQHDLALEPRLLLRYPSALNFFVRRDNDALADALDVGLARAEADGCLDRLFHATYDEVLAPLKLASRTAITLPNPVWTARAGGGR
jgi:hypothetical protein